MHLKRIVITAVMSVSGLLACALPANADEIYLGSGGSLPPCGYGQYCEGEAQSVPSVGIGGNSITAACQAVTPYVVDATVASCYIKGTRGDVHYAVDKLTQGEASNLTYTFDPTILSSTSYILCEGAGYYAGGVFNKPVNYTCGAPLAINVSNS
jgi:hypothetical protein